MGAAVVAVDRRAKYVTLHFDNDLRVMFHLSQAGRLDFEQPPKKTRPKGAVVRWRFSDDRAVLLREFGTERKAGWWVLAPDDVGPVEKLGPEATSDEFAEWFRTADDGRRIHTILRDQRTVAGVGRGYADDILHRAKLSPYASVKSLKPDERERHARRAAGGAWPKASSASGSGPAGFRRTSSASTSRCTARTVCRVPNAGTT